MTDPRSADRQSADPASAGPEKTVQWRELLNETVRRLEHAGCPDAGVSGRRIIEAASGFEGAEFAHGLDQPATVKGVARLDAMVARRIEGEPLQYVVGSWGFRQLDLLVDRRALIPRPETETVAEVALEELRRMAVDDSPLVADLGTGTGAIGLSVATEFSQARVWLTDKSADALAVARANLTGLGRAAARVNVAQGSWFEALGPDLRGQFALIVSNPPYVSSLYELPPEVADWEPTEALLAGPAGLDDIRQLVFEAPGWLRPDGSLVVEIGEGQAAPVEELATGVFREVQLFHDLADRPRGIVARQPIRPRH